MSNGPSLPFSEQLHAQKYRDTRESFREGVNRQANALADNEEHFHEFRNALLDMRFMPAGRVQSAIGSTRRVTPYNCFVSGTIEDSLVDGNGSITALVRQAAATMRLGGGIGYDFSTLRPRNALIRKLHSHSTGPVSFMEIYDALCRCISSSGHRRGAQMGVMRVDHPDVEEFIHAKQPPKEAEPIMEQLERCEPGSEEWARWYGTLQAVYRLTGFNISLAITDEFMECVEHDRPFPLRFGGQVYREVDARALWDTIMRSTWDWAEPGVLFIDQINRMNNLWYCETIAATNPCGEQPLPPFGACLLGSFNLVKYIAQRSDGGRYFNWGQFREDIPVVVRAMDNVVDEATYPLYEQEKEAKSKRRMGLGVTGLANALESLGHVYGSSDFLFYEEEILKTLKEEAYRASARLAAEKGAFPLYDERYLQGAFVSKLSNKTIDLIKKHGIRNSHLTSIAPTGTISMCADNVSSGIEPVFSYRQQRKVNMPQGEVTTDFSDYGFRVFGVQGKRSQHVTAAEHLDVLATAYRHVDSAVSKTCNVPPTMAWDQFKNIYREAWRRGCKGCTTFQTEGKRAGIIKSTDKDETQEGGSACRIDSATGRRECE